MQTKSRHNSATNSLPPLPSSLGPLSLPQLCGVVWWWSEPAQKKVMETELSFQLAAPRDFTTGSPPALVSLYARANQLPRSASSPSAKTEGDSRGLPGSRPSGPPRVLPGARGTFLPLLPSTQLCPIRPHPLKARSSLVPSLPKKGNTKGRPTLRAPKSLAQQIYGWDLEARL